MCKIKTKYCTRKGCKNKLQKRKYVCNTCYNKKWRKQNPLKYAYQTFIDNCKRRKIFCNLSFEDFCKFCYETDYIQNKGKTTKSYSIDRIKENPKIGYRLSNIRILTLGDNTRKRNGTKLLDYDWQTKKAIVRKIEPETKEFLF